MSELQNVEQSYGAEVVRKAIHLCSISIPVAYSFLPRSTTAIILSVLTVACAALDLARFYHPATKRLYIKYFGWLLRAHERDSRNKRLTGATYVLLSATLCVLIFPKVIAITAFAILIISDTCAALIGRKYGKHPFLKKSREGTTAFFVSALVVVALTPKAAYLPAEYVIGIVSALLGTVVEALSIAIDDNLSIPLSIGVTMWVLYLFFLPATVLF